MAELNVYKRTDNKFGWRLKADNGQIVVTDGSRGYSNRSDAEAMGTKVVQGGFKDARVMSG